MDQQAWIAAGRRLGEMSRVSSWWVGDWLRYGTTKWGEKYTAASKITGYDRHTLENMVYVASRFDISLRRENLSWSHHAVVAALGVQQQTHWLGLAADRRMSVADLRTELRSAQRALKPECREVKPEKVKRGTGIFCPRCGFGITAIDLEE